VPVRIPAPRRPLDDAVWPLDHEPTAAGQARRLARAVLADWDAPENTVDAMLLVVSELVTNAVEHAAPPLRLQLHREQAERRVWIGVTDGGPAVCEGAWIRSCTAQEHGRGLGLVEALTQAHGVHRHAGGTTHWARLATG
jgi:anti-sigma regulatory factor (Ser/Thr protein kinase)